MKIFDDFSNNIMQICNYKISLDEKKEDFKFEKELSKNKEKNDISNNDRHNISRNKKYKNNKCILIKDKNQVNSLNFNTTYEKEDTIKDSNFEEEDFKNLKETYTFKNDIIEVEEDLDEKILYNISLIINVDKEKINSTINDLNINLYDLKDNAKLILFLEKVFDVDNVKLLSMSEVYDIIKNIDEVFLNNEENLSVYNLNELKIDNKINFNNKEFIGNKNIYDNQNEVFNNINILEQAEEEIEYIDSENKNIFKDEKENKNNNFIMDNKYKEQLLENKKSNNLEEVSISNFNIVSENNMNIKEEIIHFSSDKKVINIKYDDIINQITNKLNSNFKFEVSELKIKLKPEELGEITLKISTENKIISAKFIAENEKVKEVIESRFNELRDILSKQGLNISELSVSVDDKNKNSFMKEFLEEKLKQKIKNISDNITIDNKNTKNNIVEHTKNMDIFNNNVDYTA